ncbi:translation initiation factor IF-2 [Gloeocapsopsis dulcis]|uniref:Translation initiation factor IF-2 n=1 Tax=Gloeocapsopsis dulcis AAB1 = 1H9 TaxID=1433147 RepID=A0A6N8FWG8_9CHRO|nr:translation initiation factor IF-2 [Gloeocapsopsis dulcis]MUL36952.1 translation initiation factor IF-2 [Gloeocapsopsis dulcis AAB1 = 1H9]WNN88768.1 translation initiation factor IF-2 [Gloeocapsopsis dulcis]
MGFADVSIAELATDYNLTVEEVFFLCERLGIAYKSSKTRLPLEDAKAIISHAIEKNNSDSQEEAAS